MGETSSVTPLAPAVQLLRTIDPKLAARWTAAPLLVATMGAVLPPIELLPPVEHGRTAVATLTTVQATVAAIGVAVMVFVLQGMGSFGIDNPRVREEFDRRIAANPSLLTLLALSAWSLLLYVLMFPPASPGAWPWTVSAGNFMPAVLINAVVTMALTWRFFARAQRLRHPSEIRVIERYVADRLVRRGVDGFVRRLRDAADGDLPSLGPLLQQDLAEAAVDDALQLHFDALRRSMRDSRLTDYSQGFEDLRGYVESAVDQVAKTEMAFGPPGAEPWWQPLSGIRDKLVWLKDDVFRATGWSPYAYELGSYDYWQISRGLQWRCGELYGMGLAGWRTSYHAAVRSDDPELTRMMIERTWRLISSAIQAVGFQEDDVVGSAARPLDPTSEDDLRYLYFLVSELDRQLAQAMLVDRVHDYVEFNRGFDDLLRQLSLSIEGPRAHGETTRLVLDRLRQARRISLLGLSGRAAELARDGRIADPQPYINVVREQYSRPGDLAADIVVALDMTYERLFSWGDWESEGQRPFEAYSVDIERYPLLGFFILSLEFAAAQDIALPLEGQAARIRGRLENLVPQAMRLAQVEPAAIDEVAQRLDQLLDESGQADARREEEEVMAADLDTDRVDAFLADFLWGRYRASTIEPIFRARRAFRLTGARDDSDLEGLGHSRFLPKAAFAEVGGNRGFFDVGLFGEQYERSLMQRFLALFHEREERQRDLSDVSGLRSALDEARSALGTDKLVAVLAGDWTDIAVRLRSSRVDWFDANWRRSEPNPGEYFLGDYGSVAVIEASASAQRYVVVIDPRTWGCVDKVVGDRGEFVCAIRPIDAARAEAIQVTQRAAGQDPTDSRELQLAVEWEYREWVRFHEIDPSRVLRFVDSSSDA